MKMNMSFLRLVSVAIILSFVASPISTIAQADMITTEAFLIEKAPMRGRERVISLLEREEVRLKLGEYGVSPTEAKNRVASLTDAEIEKLNQQIDQMPAGADPVGAVLGTFVLVFVILLITDILCWTKVFKFTRCAV